MNLKTFLKVVVALVLLVFAGSSFAQTTYYVNSVSGLDGYNGLSATVAGGGVGPKLTITNAINAATDGDIIAIAGNAGVPYNLEPGAALSISKKLKFVVTGTAIIDADLTFNKEITFEGALQVAAGRNITLATGSKVLGANNLTLNATSSNPTLIKRASGSTTFDASPNMPNAGSVDLEYGDVASDYSVGPEWANTTAIRNVESKMTTNKLTLGGNKTLAGTLTTAAGGTLAIDGYTLTLNAAGATTHSIAGPITSTSVTSGELVFVGDGNVLVNGVGAIPSVRKAGKGSVDVAQRTTINGSVTADAVTNATTLTLNTTVVTVKGGVTNNSTSDIIFTPANDLTIGGTYDVINASTGKIRFEPTAAKNVHIKGNVDNQNAGKISFSANALPEIDGNLTLSGSGAISIVSAGTIHGNVINTGTMTLTADPAADKDGLITFGNASYTVDGNVVNSKVVSVNINPTNGGASVDGVANIIFGDADQLIKGSITNRVQLSGARGTNNDLATEGGIVNSGNVLFVFAGGSTSKVTVNGDVSNETVNSFDATPGTAEGTATFNTNGNISFGNSDGDLKIDGTVKNSSTGFEYDGGAAGTMGAILASGLNNGALTLGGVVNSSTNKTQKNGNIDFGAASAGAITVNGALTVSGSAGTGDVIFGTGVTVINGDVTNSKSIAGADIVFNNTTLNAAGKGVTLNGALNNSGKSKVTFATTTTGVVIGALTIADGSITFASTSGDITVNNALVVNGGTLDLSAQTSGDVNVGTNFQFTAGTVKLGAVDVLGQRIIKVSGPTTEFKLGALFTGGANTQLLFNGAVAQTVNVSSGGTFIYPGEIKVDNQIIPAINSWTLSNGNLRVGGSVYFTHGQVNIGNNYIFILKDFHNDVALAESYVTGSLGYISMQNGTPGAQNVVTKAQNATFSNFEVDNSANGCLIGQNNSANETYTFTGAFNLTAGTVTGFVDGDDNDKIEFKNTTIPPTIYRNDPAAGFAVTPTFSSLVNVTYIGASKNFMNEVPTAADKLNNLTIATTGTSTITATSNFTVNGAVVINNGQTLALAGKTLTMSSTTGSGASAITLNGNSDITATTGKVILSRATGTTITGQASTSATLADANELPEVYVTGTSVNNTVTGLRDLGKLTVDPNCSLAVSFTNSSDSNAPTTVNVNGDLTVDGQLDLNSAVLVTGNYDVDGKLNLGAYNLQVNGAVHAQTDAAVVTTTGGLLRFVGNGATFTSTGTNAAVIPSLEVNLASNAKILEIKGNGLTVSNKLQHTMGQVKLTSGLTVTGNTYTVTDIKDASLTGAGVLNLNAAADVLTWTLNDPTTSGSTYSIATLTVSNPVTLAGTAAGGLEVTTAYKHVAGELNFGARNITLSGAATYERTGGSYNATTGYLVWNSTGSFKEGTGFSIPNFRVSKALDPANDKAMVVSNNLELGATFTQQAGAPAASLLSLGVSGGSVPTIIVKGGNFDAAPIFAQGQVNYSFAANATIADAAKYWPSTAVANNVTVDGAGITVDFAKARTINGNLNLNQGAMTITDVTVTLASGATITRSELGSLTLVDGDVDGNTGVLNAANVNLTYSKNAAIAAMNSGDEFTSPTAIASLVANNTVTLGATRTIAGDVTANQTLEVANSKTVTVNGNVSVADGKSLKLTGNLKAVGNVTMNGSATTTGNGTLTFAGAADQTFTMGSATTIKNLTIAQTADAKVNVAGSGDLTVGTVAADNLTLTRGLLVLSGTKKLILVGGFTRGGSYASHVVGTVQKSISNAAAGRYEFPVGSLTDYRPAAFTFATAPIFTFNLMVNHVDASPDGQEGLPIVNGVTTGTDIAAYPGYYWLISSSANLGSAVSFNLELTAGGYTMPTGTLISDLRIIRRVDGAAVNNPWSLQGAQYDNYLNGTVPTVTNINSMGGINPAGARFTFGLKSTLIVLNPIAAQTIDAGKTFTNKLSAAPVFGGNVGTLTYSATSSNTSIATAAISNDTLTVTGVAQGSATITVKATDVNNAYKTTTFNVTVNAVVIKYAINGTVKYDNTAAKALKDVIVKLMNGTTVVATDTTDAAGAYSFANVENGTYTVKATSTAAYGGSNATDALWIAKNYNGTQVLTPLQTAAADVNASGTVNNTDALKVLRRFNNLDSTFAAGDWTFTSPSVTVNGATATADVKALSVGDVNASNFSTVNMAKTAMSSEGTVEVNPGATLTVPVKVDAQNLGAFSLKFKYSEDQATLAGVSSKLENLQYSAKNGVVSIAWADLSGKEAFNADSKEAFITLNFKPAETMKAGKTFGVELVSGELATADAKVINNALLKTSEVKVAVPSEFALRQNYPNPFNPTTTIQYDLPVDSKVSLVVYNMLGQEVMTLVDGMQSAGTQKVQFNAQNLTSGIYFYTLNVNNGDQKFHQTYKMILMK